MLEWIPVEMRAMSVLSAILFFFGGIVLVYLHWRVNNLDKTVFNKSLDIEKLTEMCANTEKAVESIKEDNRKMIGWIRDDNKTNLGRIDKNLAAINKQLYGGE
jgi:hypothetical protein